MSSALLQSGNRINPDASRLSASLPSSTKRLGGFIFNDLLNVGVHVDWVWVKENVGLILEYTVKIAKVAGIDINSLSLNQGLDVTVPSFLIDSIINANGGNEINPRRQLKQFVEQASRLGGVNETQIKNILNSTFFNAFNSTQYIYKKDKVDVTISLRKFQIDNTGIELRDVKLISSTGTVAIGNVKLTKAQIVLLLPDRVICKQLSLMLFYSLY
jgi:hypothetical protein